MKETYLEKATDPRQYDKGEVDWSKYGSGDDPRRKFFKEALRGEVGDLHGKVVLDVGSGSGAFFDLFRERGAESIQGLEPSKNNIAISKKLFPDIPVFSGSLEEARFDKRFDVVFAVMVVEHLPDLEKAFAKIKFLLRDGGMFYLITQDKEHMMRPDYDTPIKTEAPGVDGSVAVRVGTEKKTFYDILRPVELYKSAGGQAGLKLEKHISLTASEALIKDIPRYEKYRNVPIKHLFIFKKQ